MRRPVELKGGSAGGLLMNCLFLKSTSRPAPSSTGGAARSPSLQEPCFIPRSKDAPEGDGWIVQVCNRLDEHRTDLLLFDALEIEKGPIATIQRADPAALRPARQLRDQRGAGAGEANSKRPE